MHIIAKFNIKKKYIHEKLSESIKYVQIIVVYIIMV